jgi:hypothetical protein
LTWSDSDHLVVRDAVQVDVLEGMLIEYSPGREQVMMGES